MIIKLQFKGKIFFPFFPFLSFFLLWFYLCFFDYFWNWRKNQIKSTFVFLFGAKFVTKRLHANPTFPFYTTFWIMTKKKGKVKNFFILYDLFVNVLPILKFGKICNFWTPISIWVLHFCLVDNFFVEDGIFQSKWNIWNIMNGTKMEENIIEQESEKKS